LILNQDDFVVVDTDKHQLIIVVLCTNDQWLRKYKS